MRADALGGAAPLKGPRPWRTAVRGRILAGVDGKQIVARLERWEAAGAHWRVVHRHEREVTVALCRCDGGEELERVTSDAPELASFLAGRGSSAD